MYNFDYILEKIERQSLDEYPFHHIYIENLFSDDHFAQILNAPEVNVPAVESDEQLLGELYSRNFKEIAFPGTTTDITAYLKWHKNPTGLVNLNQETTEGYGVTLRLQKTLPNTILADICAFFRSNQLWRTMASRFGINLDDVSTDVGVQKYLDGYEISPHPDIRLKALTFMININPAPNAEELNYNTQYLTLRPERDYVLKFWANNKTAERCWVPWDWCEPRKTQTKNNSMVIFSPSDNTIHSIKASYNHLETQRTQIYGNLWYKRSLTTTFPKFWQLSP